MSFVRLASCGLGLLVGAVLHTSVVAAQDTVRVQRDSAFIRDSLRADSAQRVLARRDSIRAARAADSIKAPIAPAPMPALADIGHVYRWDRSQLFASGALTLNDLLARIPGVTTYQSGWIASPQVATYAGEFRQVRVFLDGFELDETNPRAGAVQDYSTVPLWTLEEVRIERAAREIRVHMRTWTTRSTTAATRVDVATGDYDTNTYRGYYAKRFSSGVLLQAGAYQYATQDEVLGDADHLALFARSGWAKGKFSVTGTYYTLGLDRAEQLRIEDVNRPNLPRQDGRYAQAYARIAYGDPSQDGLWAQIGAGTFQFRLTRGDSTIFVPGQPPDTVTFNRDTTRVRPQYVGAIGYTYGPFGVSLNVPVRDVRGDLFVGPAARAAFSSDRLVASVFAEQRLPDSTLTADATVRVMPLSFLALSGSVGRSSPLKSADRPTVTSARAELGLRLGRVWISGGAITRDTAAAAAPVIFDSAFVSVADGPRNGTFATIRGKILGDFGIDAMATRWDEEGLYRPREQSRVQLFIDTQWRSAVPSGNLNIFAAVTHEYRGSSFFPLEAPSLPLQTPVYRTWNFQLEVRILRAVLSYQFRNVFGAQYQQVPGFLMTRQTNFYGVRWEFVN